MPINDAVCSDNWTRFRYCVAGSAKVLTDAGTIRLDQVRLHHKIFDGEEFVSHGGLMFKGVKATVGVDGVLMTPDHEVLSASGEWERADSQPDVGREVRYGFGAEQAVYDIINCGPRTRFAAQGTTGMVICHNCVERGHYQFLEKANRCDNFFAGSQWSQEDLNSLQLQRRPALTINKILATISTIQGEQIYNRNETLFRPSTGANPETAEALSKVWMQIAQNNQLPWVRSDMFADGIIRSRGFVDVRLDFTDQLRGEVRISQLNSKNVVIDPDAEEYDPDGWNDVFITKWLTYQDVALLYNDEDAEYLKDKEASLFPYAYDSIERVRDRFAGPNLMGSYYGIQDTAHVRRNIRVLERQFHVLTSQKHFVDTVTGDMRPIPDGWDRNKIASVLERAGPGALSVVPKQIKRIKWQVQADHVLLHDDWSPYQHFTVVPYFPQFRYGNTIGIVEGLIGPQEMLNKVSSQELHVINTTANSGWKVKTGALKNMSIEELEQNGAQTGLVLELDDITGAEKIQPNNVPQGLDRLSYKAEEHIKTISNVSDSMQGFDREDVAAKAIAYKQQRGSVNMTKVMDNLERTDFILARNVLDLVQSYYTEERIIHITHDDVTREAEELEVNKVDDDTGEIVNDLTLGEYNIVITSTPSRASLEDSQFEQAKAMREIGVQIPDSVLIENSRLMRRSEIIKLMESSKNSPEAQQQAELQMRSLSAQVGKLEAEVGDRQADTRLKQARAQKDEIEAQQLAAAPPDDPQAENALEMEKIRLQNELELERMQQEFAMKREAQVEELRMKREAHEQDMGFKREEAAQQAAQREQEHYAKRAALLKNPQPGQPAH